MPLFFASNAIYPIDLMPEWLQATALANPLNYLVDALRGLMVVGGESVFGVATDLGALFVWTSYSSWSRRGCPVASGDEGDLEDRSMGTR